MFCKFLVTALKVKFVIIATCIRADCAYKIRLVLIVHYWGRNMSLCIYNRCTIRYAAMGCTVSVCDQFYFERQMLLCEAVRSWLSIG